MSTLVTERRHSLDIDDGQESLFGGEAFSLPPGPKAPWQRSTPQVEEARTEVEFKARVSTPLEETGTGVAPLRDDAQAGLDEAQAGAYDLQAGVEYADGPSAEDLAAYTAFEAASGPELLAGPAVPTDVPAYGAGTELEALERATVGVEAARKPRAPLAGPTLDDVMSRVWEGLATGLPAACPVCHSDVEPSFAGALHASCSSCGTTIE